jgi:hypothetical protein
MKSGKHKQPDSGRRRFVVDMGETMSGDALNAGFHFTRSKVPNDKAWRNTYDQVKADWGTHRKLSRRWARILTRRMRHRKLQAVGMGDRKNKKRIFLCSKRAIATDGVRGRGTASFWKLVVCEDMIGYVSKVPGIGVGTGVFVLWTKLMPGVDRYDPPGRLYNWPEPIECRRHPFGFDWKARHAELARVRNLTDTPANAQLERQPKFRKPHNDDSKVVNEAVGTGNIFSLASPHGDRAGFGMLRKPVECGRHQKGSSPRSGRAKGGSYSNFSPIEYSLK